MKVPHRTRICLFGASESTSNLGVSALFHATLSQLMDRAPDLDVTVFDYKWGRRELPFRWRGGERRLTHLGANHSRRVWRAESLAVMQLAQRTGVLPNRGVQLIREADAVLDISGGDSFTDLYGPHRFGAIQRPKKLTLDLSTPLILLPQTYGPFQRDQSRAKAIEILLGARAAWARDPWSYRKLQELLGARFDPEQHLHGVDVAFGLEVHAPAQPLSARIEDWLASGSGPVVGLNVSGLVDNQARPGARSFGFRADYRQAVLGLCRRILAESSARLVLVPHVLAPSGDPESDPDACAHLAGSLGSDERERTVRLEGSYAASEVKHLIGRLDWFCGTRMHATIAALSQGVPCSAIAYSPKFQGVFDACGQSAHVADPTRLSTEELVEALVRSFHAREDARSSLAAGLVPVRARLASQFDRFLRDITQP